MEEVNNLEHLRALVKDRDNIRVQYSTAIAALVQPTVLTAMFQMFELESEAVEWSAIDIVDESLVVVVKLTYTTTDTTPQFLKNMDLISNASANARSRTLRVGIPLALVFGSLDQIQQYLLDSVEKMIKPTEPEKKLNFDPEFDATALSSDQLKQLMLYRTMHKAGEKNE